MAHPKSADNKMAEVQVGIWAVKIVQWFSVSGQKDTILFGYLNYFIFSSRLNWKSRLYICVLFWKLRLKYAP